MLMLVSYMHVHLTFIIVSFIVDINCNALLYYSATSRIRCMNIHALWSYDSWLHACVCYIGCI